MASQKKSYVFRVTGLLRERPDGDLETTLQGTIDDKFADDERSHIKAEITIVPSCYESDTERAALVQFRGGIEMGDDDVNFDCYFFRFTQLYALDENKPVVADIIAIAGLDGYTRELMEEIKKIRNTKECLVRAIQTMEEDHLAITSLYRATYGMILFAIPHKGLVMDDIQQMLGGDGHHPRETLLRQISSQSDVLIYQLADFKNLIRDRKVVSFYETKQTRQLVLKRTGDFMTTVGADSALLQLPDHVEDKVPLDVDHSMVVKFDTRNAAGYRTALDKLRQFSKEARSVVAARFNPMFVGREAVISAIKARHEAIGQRHERVALGWPALEMQFRKTQTAIEYSYRVRESAPDAWVFWIHASNEARLEQGYQQIAAVAEIPGRDDPKMNILQLVYQWLCDARNRRWLMVLDNADDDGIFFRDNISDERGPLGRFLP
ncbi:hypothetical protein N7501_007980 [Penicillium viridicatum]|nr:hypothetical protein N7501_007980 [Penicillium viridicatum]